MYDEVVDPPYKLYATDSLDQMVLCRDAGDAGCFGDGLPGPTVFAAGANNDYVAFARHPGGNKADTHFYYIVKAPDEAHVVRPDHLEGPFDQQAFETEKARLGLPEFSHIVSRLK